MNKAEKEQEIAFLSKQFELAKAILLVCFKGMSVEQITTLRKGLNPLDARLKVVRNTLARLVLDRQSPDATEDFKSQMVGDNALVFIYNDVGATAKFLKSFSKDVDFLQFKAGLIEGQFLDQSKVFYLASLPGKEELQAKLLGVLQAPTQKFISQLATPTRHFLQVLTAYSDNNK